MGVKTAVVSAMGIPDKPIKGSIEDVAHRHRNPGDGRRDVVQRFSLLLVLLDLGRGGGSPFRPR